MSQAVAKATLLAVGVDIGILVGDLYEGRPVGEFNQLCLHCSFGPHDQGVSNEHVARFWNGLWAILNRYGIDDASVRHRLEKLQNNHDAKGWVDPCGVIGWGDLFDAIAESLRHP